MKRPQLILMAVVIFIALVEDPGWVCLGYMIAEQMYKRLQKKKTTATKVSV